MSPAPTTTALFGEACPISRTIACRVGQLRQREDALEVAPLQRAGHRRRRAGGQHQPVVRQRRLRVRLEVQHVYGAPGPVDGQGARAGQHVDVHDVLEVAGSTDEERVLVGNLAADEVGQPAGALGHGRALLDDGDAGVGVATARTGRRLGAAGHAADDEYPQRRVHLRLPRPASLRGCAP